MLLRAAALQAAGYGGISISQMRGLATASGKSKLPEGLVSGTAVPDQPRYQENQPTKSYVMEVGS